MAPIGAKRCAPIGANSWFPILVRLSASCALFPLPLQFCTSQNIKRERLEINVTLCIQIKRFIVAALLFAMTPTCPGLLSGSLRLRWRLLHTAVLPRLELATHGSACEGKSDVLSLFSKKCKAPQKTSTADHSSGSQNMSVGQNMSVRFSVGFPHEKGVLSI